MVRTTRLLLVLVLWGNALAILAQVPAPPAAPAAPVPGSSQADTLPGLPHPPDEPRSLMLPPVHPGPSPSALPGPYFEPDPLLDPPQLPAPGWFAGVELGVNHPHLDNKLIHAVPLGGGRTDTVALPAAPLDWTVSPRFEAGYRLPAGFGEFTLGYRFLVSDGSETLAGPDAAANLNSRLDLNELDLDYASREFSLWPHCEMKWRFGARVTWLYFDSIADQPLAPAAAGSGILEQRESDSYVGAGPHVGVELAHRWDECGLALVGRTDGAILLGRLRQDYSETTTANGYGETRLSDSQAVPMLNIQVGLDWHPPDWQSVTFFLGYQYEYWWEVGRLSRFLSPLAPRGELSDQAILLKAKYNF